MEAAALAAMECLIQGRPWMFVAFAVATGNVSGAMVTSEALPSWTSVVSVEVQVCCQVIV